jgi:hypothetical protein
MNQANLRIIERALIGKTIALDSALSLIEWDFSQSSITHLGKNDTKGPVVVEAIEPEAELYVLAEQVYLAEKAFHDALARRNDAQIAYLREPSIMTRKAFDATKRAEEAALQIFDIEVQRLARVRATTVMGLKLKASYACPEGKLADSIVKDILLL